MPDERLWRARSLAGLRDMLRRLILEEHALRDVNPEKAMHLADAVSDLRTIIARLEAETENADAGDREPGRSKHAKGPSRGGKDDTDPPRGLKNDYSSGGTTRVTYVSTLPVPRSQNLSSSG